MIRATALTLRRGPRALLEDADLTIHPGERVGIVGANGAGKTSLFAALRGEIDIDAGTLDLPPDWRVSSVEQIVRNPHEPAREFVIDGDHGLRALQHAREQVDSADGTRIAELEDRLTEAGAWSAASRAEKLLAGLGFSPTDWMRPVAEFSGGWQMRIALARALMAPSDLLLLDEPTNHLDLDAILWLERWLEGYPGTVLVISHDTEFLDAVARHIVHFDQGKLVRYRGGYHDFQVQRAERVRQHQFAVERQSRESARLQAFVDRFRAQASKARQAQSRLKALARMQELTPLHAESATDLAIPEPETVPDPLLTLDCATLGYRQDSGTAYPVLPVVTLTVRKGDRIGILGVNGAGKSTLIRTLAGNLHPIDGQRLASRGLEIGYFAQHQLDMLDADSAPLAHLTRIAPGANEQTLRTYLGGFGFGGSRALDPVGPMSGGEKARLALALIVWRRPNLLLLDEPTNHLDVETRQALARALAGYGGSLLVVSHDRQLLRSTVDGFWIVADGKVTEFEGDLEDYRQWLNQRQAGHGKSGTTPVAPVGDRQSAPSSHKDDGMRQPGGTAEDRRTQRRLEAEARQRLAIARKPLEREVRRVENAMEAATARLSTLDRTLAEPDFYIEARRDERVQLLAEHGELTKRLETLENEWLEIQQQLEQLVSSPE